jgi:hypothetical protein
MLYVFIKELGSKKVGMKVNMNLNKQSMLIKDGYVKKFNSESLTIEEIEAQEKAEKEAKAAKVKAEKEAKKPLKK